MKMGEMFPSKYIAATDLEDGDRTLTIKDVTIEEFQNKGSKIERKPVLAFRGNEKPMVLNKTNASVITHLYGDETEDWIGKAVTLYATEVESFGETTVAIRIRNRVPNGDNRSTNAPSTANSAPATALMTQEQRDQIIEQAGVTWPDAATRKAEMQALLPCPLNDMDVNQANNVLAIIKRAKTPSPVPVTDDFDDDPFAD